MSSTPSNCLVATDLSDLMASTLFLKKNLHMVKGLNKLKTWTAQVKKEFQLMLLYKLQTPHHSELSKNRSNSNNHKLIYKIVSQQKLHSDKEKSLRGKLKYEPYSRN